MRLILSILEILSLLPFIDVSRTTLLSKRWKDLWTTVPCLDFGYHTALINGALAQWKGHKISKFSIRLSNTTPRANDLHSWLLFAIEKQVEELSLHLRGRTMYMDHITYCPPRRFYSCSSITKLSLFHVKMKIKGDVQWDRLKSLTIVGVNPLSADALTRVLDGAPHLEELIMCIEKISENFNIRSTSLKTLFIARQIRHCPEIVCVLIGSELKIWAPNLLTLEIHAGIYGTCSLDVPSLTNVLLDHFHGREFGPDSVSFSRIQMFNHVFQSICHVENVRLSDWCSEFLVNMIKKRRKDDVVVQFSNAKFLDLCLDEPAHEMLDVLEMFPKLKILTVKRQASKLGYTVASKTNPSLHHLKAIEISWSTRDSSIFPVTQIVLENARVLEKMVLRLWVYGADEENCQKMFDLAKEKVLSMPRSSPSVELFVVKTCCVRTAMK